MSYREIPVNMMLATAEAMGSAMGLKRKVEISDHSVTVEMTNPDQDSRAWDLDMFKRTNVFVRGYANPIKPVVDYNEQLENPDTVDVDDSDVADDDTDGNGDETDAEDDDGHHVSLISSARYRDYMRQDLVSQLLTPQEKWRLLAYGIMGAALLVLFDTIITVYVNGGF